MAGEHSIARIWNEETLAAIRIDLPNPPVHARNLFHVATAMYDAWAAYDSTAVGYLHHERQTAPDIASARREAISYAAYRILRARYATSANAVKTFNALNAKILELGYNPGNITTEGASPAAVGNRIASTILAWGMADGSNEAGGYGDNQYTNSQPAIIVLKGGVPQGGIPDGTDPTYWQPLSFDVALTQNGLSADKIQKFVGVNWLKTLPFAHHRSDDTKPWIDPGGPSLLGSVADAKCKQDILGILRDSARLNSSALVDISPGSVGNNPLGEDTGKGHAANPATGQPYAANPVKLGDFARVLAEFWADGPNSETPPGHWHAIANQVADNPLLVKRIGGVGPVVDDLEWDVKVYFALSSATHDAACGAWGLKRYYQGTRPITLVRYMGGKGQSSDPSGPSYNPAGLLLEPGVIEVITAETANPGGRHEGVGQVGEIAVYSWPGEPASPATQSSPVRWLLAKNWLPYQRKTFNTPAFPGFVSGHSTFSRAAAEVLTAVTGSSFFPGGMGTFTATANSYLVFERGPSQTVQLQWGTYFDAADQAGQSRRWGGIHVIEDDFVGRAVGAKCGKQAWQLALQYWDGSIAKFPPTFSFGTSLGSLQIRCQTTRGLLYKVQSSNDCLKWTDETIPSRAATTEALFSIILGQQRAKFYRVHQSALDAR